MAAEESINEFVSQSALKQLDELKVKIDEVAKSMTKLIADTEAYNKLIGGASTLKEYNAAVTGAKPATEQLILATKKLEQAQTEEAKQLAVINAQIAAVSKANRDAAKAALDNEDAYKKLNNQYKEAAERAKRLAAENAKGAKEAAKEAAALGQRLKDIDASVGQFNRNVGNYAGGIRDALGNNIPIIGQLNGVINDVSGAVSGLTGAFGKLGGAIAATGIGVFLLALGAVINYLKDFDPLVDAAEQEMASFNATVKSVGRSIVDLVSGKQSVKEFFDTFSDRAFKAQNAAKQFTAAEQDLQDALEVQAVKSAKSAQKVAELRAAATNKSIDPAGRKKLLEQALAIEEQDFKERSALANRGRQLAIERLVQEKGLNGESIEALRKNGSEFAKVLQNRGIISQSEFEKIQKAELGVIGIQQESLTKQEKIQAKQAALDASAEQKREAEQVKRDAANAKEKVRKDKELADEQKFQDDMQAIRFKNIEELAAIEAKGIDFEKVARDKANADLLAAQAEVGDSFIDETKKTNDLVAKINKDTREANIKATKEFLLDNIGVVTDSIFSIITAGFDRQKNALQDQIDKSEELKNAEIDRITASTASEEEKAARIAVVNAKAQADKERLEKKQRELDKKKAIADKQKAIFDIIINTAIAVVKALPNVFLAAATGVLGAAQLATVLAQPIPKFAKGTNYSPEGLAYVGEQGQEMVVTPSGKKLLTPGRATLTYLERGSKVIPNHKLNSMALDGLAGVSRFTSNTTNDYAVLAKATNDSADKITKAIKSQSGTVITEGGLYQQHLKAAKLSNYIKRNLR